MEKWIYDVECLPNFHSFYSLNLETREEKCFIIHYSRNDIIEYLNFLNSLKKGNKWLIGFNNINYDYPIIYYIMNTLSLKGELFNNPNELTRLIRKENDRIISLQFSSIPPYKVQIRQLDPYKIHHFDNPAKRTSLKYIEGVLRMEKIEEYDDFNKIVKEKDIPEIIDYNRYDVLATERFFNETLNDIKMRVALTKEYKIDLMNADDPKLGSEIFALFIAKEKNIEVKELKKMRTNRSEVALKDCILPYIHFKTDKFKSILSKMKNKVIDAEKTKKPFEYKVEYKDAHYVFGIGGIHACTKSGRYKKEGDYYILDTDVGSFYPALSVENDFYPEHLGKGFCDIYKEKYHYRLSIKHDKSMKPIAGGWKLALNGVSGLGQNKHSYFYDLKFPLDIRINGQLLLMMLIEQTTLEIDCKILQVNTDGFTMKIHKNYIDNYYTICKKWEQLTRLNLEFQFFKEIGIADVNNYFTIADEHESNLKPSFPETDWYDNKYTIHKTKGRYQIVQEANGKIAYHKNWDKTIVKKAVYDYFVHSKSVEETIRNSKDIFDFCNIYKSASQYKTIFTDKTGKSRELGKVVRYYISSGGGKLIKERKVKLQHDQKGANQGTIEAGYSITLFNDASKFSNIKSFSDYRIDYTYYIREAYKLINGIEKQEQLTLGLF